MSLWLIWLLIFVVLIIIEIATTGLTTIWFAGGALVALIGALFGAPLWLQIGMAIVISVILLVFTRPFALKYINTNQTKTNVEGLVGRQAVVTKPINNVKGEGQATLDGIEWTARTASDEERIACGEIVDIKAISGVKLIVAATGKKEDE